ncbi:MAG: hypothetical protein ACOCRK_07920 [bacterium]
MARKTIYIKDDKEHLYDKALKLSGERSLSAIFEKVVEELVQEKSADLQEALYVIIMKDLKRDLHDTVFIRMGLHFIPDDLLMEASYIVDILRHFHFLNNNIWKSPFRELEFDIVNNKTIYSENEDDWLDIDLWLGEMFDFVISSDFEEYKDMFKEENPESHQMYTNELSDKLKQQILWG